MSGFPERLRRVMHDNRLSQRQLARISNVSRQAIGAWLTGAAMPHHRTLERLSQRLFIGFGISADWLLRGEGDRLMEGRPTAEGKEFMTELATASELMSPLMEEYQALLADSERRVQSLKLKMRELSRQWHRTVREVFMSTIAGAKKDLQSKGKPLDVAGMETPLTLSALLSRVRNATRKQGDKKKLAARLNIKPQQLSQWLSGDYEPGGGYTLKLMKWVASKEAQQKQSPEGAQTPSERKTQLKSSSHEKPKSDQKKRSRNKAGKSNQKRRAA